MESGAENKYLIDSDSYEMFDNITRFAKNVKLKDSKKLYNAENALSSEFGRLLLKYYDSELSNTDIISLINNVNEYNNGVNSKFNRNEHIFGIPKTDSTEKIKDTSLFKKIINKIKSDIESIEDVPKDDVNLVIPNIIYTAFNTTNGILDTDETVLENICKFFGIKKPTDANERHNECKNFISMVDYYKNMNPYEIICNISNSDKTVSGTNEKRSASAQETTWMESGEQVLFFDLRNIKMTESEIDKLGIDTLTPDQSVLVGAENSYTIDIFIIYKELNNEYRKILNSPIQERVLSLINIIDKTNSTPILNSKYFSTKNIDCIASSTFENTYRNFKDTYELIITPNTEMDIYRYLYANAYNARKAEESGIVAYYYGDNYTELSNGYGQYSYEKEEIKNFLNIYEETRLYFYKVLLNKSFINESYYHTYEKSFIMFTAIERFLSNKNDTLKDIESMNITDMKNFMESYGLKDLSDIISDTRYGDFINKEKYIRRLLHNYTNLLHEKGSRAVIDRLLTIFDYDSTDIDITKYLIYDNEFSSIDGKTVTRNKDENTRLRFVETKYFADDNNATRSIIESIPTTNKDYDAFLEAGNDKYWLPSNSTDRKSKLTPSDILLSGLSVSETKYLSLKVSENLSDVYMNSRYFIAYIDEMKDKGIYFIGTKDSNGNIVSIDASNNSIFSLYNAIQFVFKALNTVYGKTIKNDSDNNDNTRYWINFKNLENDYENESSDDMIKKYISVTSVSNQQDNSDGENAQTKMFCLNSDTAYQLLEHTSSYGEAHPKVVDSLKTLNNMIKGLTLLILNDNNAISKDTRAKILNEIIGQKIDVSSSEYPSYNIEHALSFIHSYVSGELFNTTLPVTSEYYALCNAIFNRYFMTKDTGVYGDDELEIGKNDKYLIEKFKEYSSDIVDVITSSEDNKYTIEFNEKVPDKKSLISSLSSLLIELVNAANSIFNTDISDYTNVSFSMGENISRVLNFMEATITYFISYTTQIRDSNYIQILDSKIEKYMPSDNIGELTLESTDIDNIFYDEQFELTAE